MLQDQDNNNRENLVCTLPVELMVCILSFLNPQELVRARQVCAQFRLASHSVMTSVSYLNKFIHVLNLLNVIKAKINFPLIDSINPPVLPTALEINLVQRVVSTQPPTENPNSLGILLLAKAVCGQGQMRVTNHYILPLLNEINTTTPVYDPFYRSPLADVRALDELLSHTIVMILLKQYYELPEQIKTTLNLPQARQNGYAGCLQVIELLNTYFRCIEPPGPMISKDIKTVLETVSIEKLSDTVGFSNRIEEISRATKNPHRGGTCYYR